MKNLSQPIRADGRRPTMILTDKKTSSAISGSAKPSVKRLNGLECCHIRPDNLDHASQIHSENRWQFDASMRCIARPDLGVEWAYSTRLDANEYLAHGDRGKLSFGEDEWPAMAFKYEGTHGSRG
jgi:hypothetical protein